MSDFYCFNIGTGHNRNERTNLLVRLFHDCPVPSIDPVARAADSASLKLINDGVGSADSRTGKKGAGARGGGAGGAQGWGIKDLTDSTIAMLEGMRRPPTRMFLAGHSRGAILSVRIAAKMWESKALKNTQVYLFLLDPVKFSALGTDFYNRELHPNTAAVKIIVMEDLHNICGYKSGFKLLTIKRNRGGVRNRMRGNPRDDLPRDRFIRMPGSHGTGSQVDGNPIGVLTYQIARRQIQGWGGKVGADTLADAEICNEYFRVHEVNPMSRRAVSAIRKKLGGTALSRKVNDNFDGTAGNFNQLRTDSRSKLLDKKGITNQYRGGPFFINEHHAGLFQELYPKTCTAIKAAEHGVRYIGDLNGELQRMYHEGCWRGYQLLGAVYGISYTPS